jgi:cytochrome o ubiquinol oxidase subunit II
VTEGEFNAWIQQARGAASVLDDATYAELTKPSKDVPPTMYRSAEPKRFERILDQTMRGPENTSSGGGNFLPARRAGG